MMAWTQGPVEPPADLLTQGPGGCAAYTGYFSDADTVSKLAAGLPLADVVADAGGCFSCYREHDGILEAATILSRIDSIYRAETPRVAVFSSRALLTHLVAQAVLSGSDTPSIRLDHLGLREVAQAGFCVTDATTFEGVRAVPPAAVVTVSRKRTTVSVTEPVRVPAAEVRPGSAEWDARLDSLAAALIRAVEPARLAETPAYLGLSGGRDSRMLIAAMSAAKIDLRTGTSGDLTHPDVRVATELAAVLGVPHNVRVPTGAKVAHADSLLVPHPVELARHAAWSTDGMVSTLDVPQVAGLYRENQVNLSGSGGEVARGGYFCTEDQPDPQFALKIVENLFGRPAWLRTSRSDEVARARQQWSTAVKKDHLQAMDQLYLQYRAGRWLAANRAAAVTHTMYVHPLLDHGFVRRVLDLPVEYRYSELVGQELVQRLDPRISELPLAFRRWRCDTEPHAEAPEHDAWTRRAPVLLDATVTAPDWRRALPGTIREQMRAQLLSPAADELYQVADRNYVKTLLERPTGAAIALWRLMTLSALVDGSWERARPGDLEPISIPRPTPLGAAI
jgi:asparagine synthetase B (glutamine-hydrolysing)